jgi:AraC-like DNA-binding protein
MMNGRLSAALSAGWESSMKQASTSEKVTSDHGRDDLLVDLIGSIRLRTALYWQMELGAPWGVSLSAGRGAAFQIVARGTCWLEVAGVANPVELSEGDLVVLPRGDAHLIRNPLTTRAAETVKCDGPNAQKVFRLGSDGPVTRLLCSSLRFANGTADRVLAILPPLLHLKPGTAAPWVEATVSQILEEFDSDRLGADAVVTRLAEVLLTQAVRAFFEQNADRVRSGWLAAVRDKQVGRALTLMHAEPERPWTISSLADHAAVSRSVFATKFSQLVGEPPLRHLTGLRLNSAAVRLRSTEDSLKTIAAAAGYHSVAAFAKAFKRRIGAAPGQYRHTRGRVEQLWD